MQTLTNLQKLLVGLLVVFAAYTLYTEITKPSIDLKQVSSCKQIGIQFADYFYSRGSNEGDTLVTYVIMLDLYEKSIGVESDYFEHSIIEPNQLGAQFKKNNCLELAAESEIIKFLEQAQSEVNKEKHSI